MSIFEDGAQVEITNAYNDVRNAETTTIWLAVSYEGKKVKLAGTGTEYSEFLQLLDDDERLYGYARFETGDEMSTKPKFAFITWIGPSVSPLKKAKVSTDKAFIKQICSEFGKEFLVDGLSEAQEAVIVKVLEQASGAAYGTGK